MPSALLIFTSKQHDDIVELGGTGWWKVNPAKARKTSYVVLVHNAHDRWRSGDPDRHGQSFMIATIRDIAQDEDGRWLIQFNEYAETDAGVEWPGYRNPVTYIDSDETLTQLTVGEWKTMRPVPLDTAKDLRRRDDASVSRMRARAEVSAPKNPAPVDTMTFGQIIDHHRSLLANHLGIDPKKIRISIETS